MVILSNMVIMGVFGGIFWVLKELWKIFDRGTDRIVGAHRIPEMIRNGFLEQGWHECVMLIFLGLVLGLVGINLGDLVLPLLPSV